MIGFYNYTVILTYMGTLFGFAGITYCFNGNFRMALVCLMVAGFCDMFDGKIASTMKRTKQEKRFGIQIDSLSDLICFGVLPAMLVHQCSNGVFLRNLIPAVYTLCALIRLAWFNVDEEERQEQQEGARKIYLGLPVTTVALLLPFFAGLARILFLPVGVVLPWMLFLTAIAFITPFQLKKPGRTGKILMLLCGLIIFLVAMIGVQV